MSQFAQATSYEDLKRLSAMNVPASTSALRQNKLVFDFPQAGTYDQLKADAALTVSASDGRKLPRGVQSSYTGVFARPTAARPFASASATEGSAGQQFDAGSSPKFVLSPAAAAQLGDAAKRRNRENKKRKAKREARIAGAKIQTLDQLDE